METLFGVHATMKQSSEAAAIFSEIVIIYKSTLTEDLKKSDFKVSVILACALLFAGPGGTWLKASS